MVSTLLFEYADSGSTNWIPIGYSDYIGAYCNYLYYTSWDPLSLGDGTYQVRAISHDTCSNQDDDMAPVAFFTKDGTTITPYNPDEGALYDMTFLKNWCTGDMQGIVQQTSDLGMPVIIGMYGSSYECIDMQAAQGSDTEFAGSFEASGIAGGGTAYFFSSVTVALTPPPQTGEPASVTYLLDGQFDVLKVKTDLGTHWTYEHSDGCTEVTIPDAAVNYDRYIWVAPTLMEWAPVTQPDILPIGDANGYATHISFTDCAYCCDWFSAHFEGGGFQAAGAGAANGSCCFNDGKYAIIKMCYDPDVDTDKEHLAVAWWDCYEGEYSFDNVFYPATVGGFDVEAHTVEFATTCLEGPFVVVQLLERECDGTIVVDLFQVAPYCDGYTNSTPIFSAMITDNVQGTEAIDQGSICWWVDLFNPGELVRIYDGSQSSFCDKWMPGFGNFPAYGYDEVSGIFRAGWNDPTFGGYYDCDECAYRYHSGDYYYFCDPLYTLAAGDHMATVSAWNDNIQTCTDTLNFMVDATAPMVWFADAEGAYVGGNPHLCIYFTDTESGVDKSSVYIDIYGDETNSPDPNNHHAIGTLEPAQLNWVDDTTVCVDGTFDYYGGYLHIYVYGGPECECGGECNNPQYYDYTCGISDCVGNQTDVFWQYYSVDADGPSVTMDCESSNGGPIKITIHDAQSGVDWSSLEFFEDGILLCDGLGCIDEESISLDTDRGILVYTPDGDGVSVEIRISDNLGNLTVESCDVPVAEEDVLTLDPHNYPNPFDPTRDDGLTYIVPGLSKTCRLTVKIYDFAGEFVTELQNGKETSTGEKIKWDGTTDGGTEVANGTYLCYLYANCDGSTKTAVIKITVLKEDK
jgi:hypothetical protein